MALAVTAALLLPFRAFAQVPTPDNCKQILEDAIDFLKNPPKGVSKTSIKITKTKNVAHVTGFADGAIFDEFDTSAVCGTTLQDGIKAAGYNTDLTLRPNRSSLAGPATATGASLSFGTASDIAIADFNGDGILDFASPTLGGQLLIYLSTGNGGNHQLSQTLKAGNTPTAAVAGDFNGDGVLDLAVVNLVDNSVSIFLGSKSGTFQTQQTYPAGNSPIAVGTADVNGDGNLDLVVADCACGSSGNSTPSAVSVLAGKGDGTFGALATLAPANEPLTLVIVDLNGDGKPDIAFGEATGNTVAVMLANSSGGFAAPVRSNAGGTPNYIGFGDFNGDGKIDLAVLSNLTNTLQILPGQGTASFGPPVAYMVGNTPNDFSIGDFNQDGYLDIALADADSGNMQVLLGGPHGTLGGPRSLPVAGSNISLVTIGDFNGDGSPDFVVGSPQSPGLELFLNPGGGAFSTSTAISLPGGNNPTAVISGDFNSDGRTDLAVGTSAGVAILLGEANGGFSSQTGISSSASSAIAVADLTGDGNLDLAVASSTAGQGNISVYSGDGNGNFKSGLVYQVGTNPVSVVAVDLNGDGKPDLVVSDGGSIAGQSGKIYVLLNRGDGNFTAPVGYAAGSNPGALATGDLNGDGKLDVVAATNVLDPSGFPNGNLAVLLGNGDGTLKAAVLYPSESGPTSVVIQDLNFDGVPDVLVSACCGLSDLDFFAGVGDGTLLAYDAFPGGASPQGMATADFNGDGKIDLVVAASAATGLSSSGAAVVMINQTPSPVAALNDASFAVGQPVAASSIVAAFGAQLAIGSATATTLSTSLNGTTVAVEDSAGNLAEALLFFVSKAQVNFQMPAGLVPGPARFEIRAGDGVVSAGPVTIAPVAPGMFQLNGGGLAAAYVVVSHADGTQTVEQVYTVNSSGAIVANPIILGAPTDAVYLILYGTGLQAAGTGGVKVSVGGTNLPVSYAGAQGVFAGLDQVNLQLPLSFAGKGNVTIQLTANGISANPVNIAIQ